MPGIASELDRARGLGSNEDGLVVVVTTRADGTPTASVVNAGVLAHPVTDEPVVAFVARGGARKLPRLRARPLVTVVFRSAWDWVAVEGDAQLAGPDDTLDGLEPRDVPRVLREIYAAAVGGTVEDWESLNATFAAERHTAVLVHPKRIYSNPA